MICPCVLVVIQLWTIKITQIIPTQVDAIGLQKGIFCFFRQGTSILPWLSVPPTTFPLCWWIGQTLSDKIKRSRYNWYLEPLCVQHSIPFSNRIMLKLSPEVPLSMLKNEPNSRLIKLEIKSVITSFHTSTGEHTISALLQLTPPC